jgi:hypothetical protein
VNNKNENQNIDIIITEHGQNNSRGQEIIDKEKNINLEFNINNLNNNLNIGKDNLNLKQNENLGKENPNINIYLIHKANDWTEILYNIVDNFSEENSCKNNSEESNKSIEEKKEIKNQTRETNNNSDIIENENKPKNLLSKSPSKNKIDSNNEDFEKTKELNDYQKNIISNQHQIKIFNDNTIIFDGKEFKCFNRDNIYKRNDNLERYIYKCINYRKEEKFLSTNKMKRFCSATIVYIPPGKKKKQVII